jgi:hypothetical protein
VLLNPSRERGERLGRAVWNPELKAAIREEGAKLPAYGRLVYLSKKYQIPRASISRILYATNRTTTGKYTPRPTGRTFTDEDIRSLHRRVGEGEDLKEVATDLGMSVPYAYECLRGQGRTDIWKEFHKKEGEE